jgi:hypothetical protein
VLLAFVVAAPACTSPPAQPSPVALGAVTGHVTDAIDGASVVGAHVVVRDTGQGVITAGDGSFTLPIPDSGTARIRIEASGYWTRTTRVSAESAAPAEIDLLPDDKGFSLPFFDYVFRFSCGGPGLNLGTKRWLVQPTFEVWTSEFSCSSVNVGPGNCVRTLSTGRGAPAPFLEAVSRVLAEDIDQYTGGVLTGAPVRYRSFPPDTRVRYPEDALQHNVITIAYVDDDLSSLGSAHDEGPLGVTSGYVQVHGLDYVTELTSHELAHTLGYDHPCGGINVPLPSTMRIASRPSEADRLHGRILYRRPPVSSSPDHDPDWFVINEPG